MYNIIISILIKLIIVPITTQEITSVFLLTFLLQFRTKRSISITLLSLFIFILFII